MCSSDLRIAEDLFVKKISTGASNDYERATKIARDMVTRYGMSAELGPMVYAENESEVFLGRSVTKTTNISEATMQKVDAEIRRILEEQYAVAQKILEENKDKVEAMTEALMQWETIDRDQVLAQMQRLRAFLGRYLNGVAIIFNIKSQRFIMELHAIIPSRLDIGQIHRRLVFAKEIGRAHV